MNFKLDPPSGLSDSYLDIEFAVTCDKAYKTVLTLHNDTLNQQLDIIGVVFGYILNGNTVVVKNNSQLRGHFNIFNYDKMNEKFNAYEKIVVRCKIEQFNEDDESIHVEEDSLTFYNESHSLDSEVIPFDLIIYNDSINIENNEPLKLDLISGIQKTYTLCISSSRNSPNKCYFEILAKEGKTSIDVPSAIMAHDLNLNTTISGNDEIKRSFNIYYVLYQGTTFSRVSNRKYIKINKAEINFLGSKIGISPQTRKNPIGIDYSDQFILSDRYLVPCPREYSNLSKKSEFGIKKLVDLTMLINEGQHMENLAKEIKQFSATNDSSNKISQTHKAINKNKQTVRKISPKTAASQIQMMKGIAGAYESVSNVTQTKSSVAHNKQVESFAAMTPAGKSSGCAPCARKRNNA